MTNGVYINRELSWLRFNERVLLQAAAPEVPLLERLRFLSIFASNLDEFFMVRAGSLHDRSLLPDLPPDNKTGLSAAEQLAMVYGRVRPLISLRDGIDRLLADEAGTWGIRRLSWDELSDSEKKQAKQFFKKELAPLAAPCIIDDIHGLPFLDNKRIHVLVSIRNSHHHGRRGRWGVLPMPKDAPSICFFEGKELCYIPTEELLFALAPECFGGKKDGIRSRLLFRVTRNADIAVAENFSDDPASELDYPTYLKILLKKRAKLGAIRLEIRTPHAIMSEKQEARRHKAIDFLLTRLNLTPEQLYENVSPLSWDFISPLIRAGAERMGDGVYQPIMPTEALAAGESIFTHLRSEDILIHYPYHSVRTYMDFLKEAVIDPDVTAISITLYRMSSQSRIIALLCEAAQRGKEVTAVVELKARFDEENNLHWAACLEEAGCRVICGMNGLKVHSKVTLIRRRCGLGWERFVHIGTGNYNEQTAKLYTDLGLLTNDPAIGEDAERLFESLSSGELRSDYETLPVSPTTLKDRILSEIGHEKRAALEGRPARIRMKMNSLTDKDIIDALASASEAGVKVELVIRGICCLCPGIKGLTDNIRVISIVGRYLEHARIYLFGEGAGQRGYIGSADLMTRNTTRRIEVLTPIRDGRLLGRLQAILEMELRDNVKASELGADGVYHRIRAPGYRCDSQVALFDFWKN